MRQLTMTADRRVEWWDVPEPELRGDGEALVRPVAVALCDLDQPILRGEAPIPGPIALGHEFVAEVIDAGDDVRTVGAGDRVVVPFQISCGACARCRAGQTGDCTSVAPRSMYGFGAFGGDWGGALSDVVRVPYADAMLVAAPDGVATTTLASVSDNVPDGWRTVAPHLARRPGAEVLVVGGGGRSIALYAVDAARALGAGRVVYADADPARLAIAEELGAEPVAGPFEASYGEFPITVDASAAHDGLHAALRSTEPGGVCTSVGIYYEPLTPMPLLEMFTNGITFVTGRAMARAAIPDVLERIARGDLHPERVTSSVVAWADAAEAVGEAQTKLVIARDS
jgi:threonine dehydrogenase-like Zn-dependent dehydrogenase